jgi:dTMP kinase|uniref:Thymidylate kinase n=1 Tax=Leptospirillum ferriphilum TaxID=178606 RepID=A0A7C3QSV1_9BACT
MTHEMTGTLITFEGIDGSGKTTQARDVLDVLIQRGHPAMLSREPGATPLGGVVRNLLLSEDLTIGSMAELFLFLADRSEHVEQVLRPRLSTGQIVLVDRFTDATTAYQGYGMNHPLETLESLHRMILGEIVPTKTYLLDISPEKALERVRSRAEKKNRIEERGLAFFSRVREGYLEIARKNPQRICILDATLPREEISRRILKDLAKFLPSLPDRGKEERRTLA